MRRVLISLLQLVRENLTPLVSNEKLLSTIISTINSALLLSHGIRKDTTLYIVVGNHGTLKVEGSTLRNYRPDYYSARGLIVKALKGFIRKGITFRSEVSLKDIINRYSRYNKLELSKRGIDIEGLKFKGDILIIDTNGETLGLKGFYKVMIKPYIYSIDQRIAIVQNWLDKVASKWKA